jgi:hypothetical protein
MRRLIQADQNYQLPLVQTLDADYDGMILTCRNGSGLFESVILVICKLPPHRIGMLYVGVIDVGEAPVVCIVYCVPSGNEKYSQVERRHGGES